jgi:hypothetical protein
MMDFSKVWWSYIQTFPEDKINWYTLSRNPNLTCEIIEANLHLPWKWYAMTYNPNITLDYIKQHPDRPWCWGVISEKKEVTWEIIQANPDLPWDWWGISRNPNITWEIIQANLDKPWKWETVCSNPNMTWDNINKCILYDKAKRGYDTISGFLFINEKEEFDRIVSRTLIFKHELMACTGQAGWYFRSCVTEPFVAEDTAFVWDEVKDWHILHPVNFRILLSRSD